MDLAAAENPDVVIMDIAMPQLNGVEATRQIVNRNPHTAVAILSMHKDESYVIRSLKAGARAYLLKDSAEADLIAAIGAITEGKSFFSPAVRSLLKEDYMHQLDELGAEDSYELLTNREREVLQLVAEGKGQQGDRRDAQSQPVYGGDPPHPYPAKAEPAQRAGADPVRGAQGDHQLGLRKFPRRRTSSPKKPAHSSARMSALCVGEKDM